MGPSGPCTLQPSTFLVSVSSPARMTTQSVYGKPILEENWGDCRADGRVLWLQALADNRLISKDADGTVKVWDTATSNQLTHIADCVAISPKGDRVLTLAGAQGWSVWDVEQDKELARLRGLGHSAVTVAVFDASSKRIATASSAEGTVWIWDVATGNELGQLVGHRGGVYSAFFDPESRSHNYDRLR